MISAIEHVIGCHVTVLLIPFECEINFGTPFLDTENIRTYERISQSPFLSNIKAIMYIMYIYVRVRYSIKLYVYCEREY